MKVVWAEKHRPTEMQHFRGQDHLKSEMYEIMFNGKEMQHYIFYSREPGTGKTTLAYMLARELGYQIHKYNASSKKQRGIEFIEEEIALIARSGQNEVIVLLDEADQLTPAAQSALKGVIEDSTCFFILTCNDLSKVSPWLQSRCQVRTFQPIPLEDMEKQLAVICATEGVEIGDVSIKVIAKRHEGDMRNAIGALQSYASLPEADKQPFLNSLTVPKLDAKRFLQLCFKEKAIDDAYTILLSAPPRKAVRQVFTFAVSGVASVENKLKVIDASIQTERDLINGVDEQIALYNFVRILAT
jgi:replication factor C small subunit|tara:strand:+ start:9759 stop:10658 length:900 start_codon:yes stop_codon:yes gene_type:complete